MPELHFPWIEASTLLPLLGALWLTLIGDRSHHQRDALVFSSLTLLLTIAELFDFMSLRSFEAHEHWIYMDWLFDRDVFVIDELSAFQLPLVALVFLVTILATLRTKAPRFSLRLTLVYESILLATFSCRASWTLVMLLIAGTLPLWLELKQRNRCRRIYTLHMLAFAGLIVLGYGLQQWSPSGVPLLIASALLAVAALLRSGVFPLHLWLPDLFEKASFGSSILACTPMVGAYAAMRLVLPIAPSWALQSMAVLSLITAVYAASLSLIQTEARRMFCYLMLSQSSLVLAGLELVTPIGLTGALCLWLSVGLSLTGFGITLRCVEARIHRISLRDFHGLYPQMPLLAGFFLLTGLASIGFPATIGFIGMELLIEGAVAIYPSVGILVALAAALCGITVVQAYFRIFTGHANPVVVPLRARPTERIAVYILTVLIVGGGLYPQPGVASRFHAAEALTAQRAQLNGPPQATAPVDIHAAR